MLSSWFGSKSSRRQTRPPVPDNAQSGQSDASSFSQSTVGPLQTSGNLTSASDVIPLDEVHAHINDPNVYAPPTPSPIHSAEKVPETSTTPGALTTSLDATTYQPDSTQRVRTPDCLGETVFTPQDAIIAQIYGRSAPPATDSAYATPPLSSVPQPSASKTSDSLPPLPSMQTPPSSGTRLGPTLPVYDPFSGVKLGERTPMSPSATTPGETYPFAPIPTVDDRKLWSSLERILELQAEIAAMHADMEGVGRGSGNTHTGGISGVGTEEGGKVGPKKGLRRGQTLLVGDEEPDEQEPEGGVGAGVAPSEISIEHSDGEDGEDEINIHGYGKKRRDEEFTRLAEHFAQRKAAIGGIMNKLDGLSMALKTFHALPPPLFDLAMLPSRTDTMSSAPSNVSATSSPTHVHLEQPSSPPPSLPPLQATSSLALPVAPISPPIPPISTLVSSGDPSFPLRRASVVAPVLPPTAIPTIIPGAPQVDSPADMDPVQSIIRVVP